MKSKIIKIILISLILLCIVGAAAFAIYQYRDDIFPTDRIAEALEEGKTVICFIDVGQADSILVMTPKGNMLIDTGTTASQDKLKDFLRDRGVEELEYLLLTHPHDDHIGGADMVLDNFKVKNVIMTKAEDQPELLLPLIDKINANSINVIDGIAGTTFELGGTESTILAPTGELESMSTNNTSIVFRMDIGKRSVLFTGDAEADVEAELIESCRDLIDCDILKLGHHGSKTSSTHAFLEAVSPVFAVSLCGDNNTYAHPEGEIIYKLDIMGIRLLRTDRDGDIVFICDGESLEYLE